MEMRWIPISERLPENGFNVLLSFSNFGYADIGYYDTDPAPGFYTDAQQDSDGNDRTYESFGLHVNAWMPLPECYREK